MIDGFSYEDIKEVKNYLINRELPNKVDTNVKAKRYNEKWNQYEIRDNKWFYKKLNLEIVLYLPFDSGLLSF